MAGVKLSHVPYRGAAPALSDLLGGHIPLLFSAIPNVHSHIGAGTVRALAVTSAKRSSLVPDMPTGRRIRLPGLRRHAGLWPAGAGRHAAPDHRPAQSGAARRARATRPCSSSSRNEGVEPLATTPEEFTAMIDREEPKWSALIKAIGLKPRKIRTTHDTLVIAAFDRGRSRSSPASPASPRAGAGLSDAADHAGRALCRRRRQRRDGAHRRREDEQDARPADRDREPAGAGGAIATRQVAKAAPDGYTLVIGGTGSLAVNPTLCRMSATTCARISRRSA